MSKSAYLYDAGDHNGPHLMFFTALKDGMDGGLTHTARQCFPVLTGSYRRRNRPRRKGCRRFLCSQWKLQSGPTERPHLCIKSRLTTTQCKKAQITCGQTKAGGLPWHDLRHTFATRLRGERVHELDIMQLLGHSSLAVSAGYAHGMPTVIQSARFRCRHLSVILIPRTWML